MYAFCQWAEASSNRNTAIGTGISIKEFIVGVNQTKLGETSVISEGRGEVEFRIVEGALALWSAVAHWGAGGACIESAEAEGKLLRERNAHAEAGPDSVVSEPEAAEVITGVVTDFQGCAKSVKQSAVLLDWGDNGFAAFTARSGGSSESVQARASGQNQC